MKSKIEIDVKKIHPWLLFKMNNWIADLEKKGYAVIVTSGYRTWKEQDKCFKDGYSKVKGGHSQHNWGIAIDFAINYDVNRNGKISDDTWNEKGFKVCADIAKKHGLGWGGDWKSFVDRPHLYLTSWGDGAEVLRKEFGTLAKFKSTWTDKVKVDSYLRKGKVFTSKTLCTIKKGSIVEVLYVSKFGVKFVKYDGKYGFVKSKNF